MNTGQNKIILTTPEELGEILRQAVQAGVRAALKEQSSEKSDFFNEKEAGEYLRVAPTTLRIWRSEKRGPKYIKLDRMIRYAKNDLDQWLKSCEIATIDSLEDSHGKFC